MGGEMSRLITPSEKKIKSLSNDQSVVSQFGNSTANGGISNSDIAAMIDYKTGIDKADFSVTSNGLASSGSVVDKDEKIHDVAQSDVTKSDVAVTEDASESGARVTSNPLKQVWSKTGGRMIRKNHDAMNELHEAMQGGDWDSLTEKEKNAWKAKNIVAYKRYMGSEKIKAKTAARIEKRKEEEKQALEFLKEKQAHVGPLSMLTSANLNNNSNTTGQVNQPKSRLTKSDMIDIAADTADVEEKSMIVPGIVGNLQEANLLGGRGADALDSVLGGVGAATNIVNLVKGTKDAKDAFKDGGSGDKLDAVVDMAGNLANVGGSAGEMAEKLGKNWGGNLGGATGVVAGVADVYGGARQAHQGRMQQKAMEDFKQTYFKGKAREQLKSNNLLLRDAASQGRLEGIRGQIKGYGKVVTGAIDTAANIADLSGAGSAVGAVLDLGNTATKAGFAVANKKQKNKMVNKVVEQVSGLTDDVIAEFQKKAGIENFSRAKQALMKALGYKSGERAELYAHQTEKRAQYLAEAANSATANENTVQFLEKLGVDKKDGVYDADDIADKLGHWRSREEIANHGKIRKKTP